MDTSKPTASIKFAKMAGDKLNEACGRLQDSLDELRGRCPEAKAKIETLLAELQQRQSAFPEIVKLLEI
jgi:branched-subunit amino acid aminotransferase/4-amino-4-deoxychorismate lyase